MLSKARIKYVKSLQLKKYREAEQRFIVEGEKSVVELLQSDFQTDVLFVTETFITRQSRIVSRFTGECVVVKDDMLEQLGTYKTNTAALAIARIKPNEPVELEKGEYALILDDIRDPGNLGTIIRIADWYGITSIIASTDTTDVYNSKTLHASMGSFTRVRIFYTHLDAYLRDVTIPVWGACMAGENVHTVNWGKEGLVVIGNEAHGISPQLEKYITHNITIPRFGGAESLNAAVAAAIICDNIRRS
jgi:RNA methyltransferase, TrmH family